MRILWFAITPCGAAEKLTPGSFTAGWLAALEQQVKHDPFIDLSVSFYYNGKMDPFEYKSVQYYPVSRGRGQTKLAKLLDRLEAYQSNRDERYIEKLVKVIETVRPDVIHIHGTEDNFGLIQKYVQLPVVFSIQSLLTPYREKFFSGIPYNVASSKENLSSKLLVDSVRNNFFLFSKWAKREVEMLKPARFVIGRTSWDKRATRILAPKSLYFVGNEIMRNSFYRHEWKKQAFSPTIKIVTTMSGGLYKGLESVLKTAAILTCHNFDFQWLVVGQTESGKYPQMVQRWLKKDYSANGITFLGSKTESELVDILCDADLYCQVSHIENSPNSLCEAMLLGMPVVATFAGGTDSMLENGLQGMLVQDGDSYSLAGAIKELAEDFEKSRWYGQNARQTALERHDPKKVANEIIDVYKEIYSLVNKIEI
ncbi:Glycosyltransferase involved in cell wall bisynthesis [Dyadobacter koreensis]|uniref:Glycosyltransferase involved in cell wall bisynthesis n=1 Tax=Dyadobacter koreensis TaxID=408657 RepID=A0A1H6QMA0_9BACT|nr:glycosyltransferase family 4 protein [Dyadobacter koreensis]SEI40445.1 Glycosyltransferase involved in cell wall bisynthesis [Dyadobacter koreensis]